MKYLSIDIEATGLGEHDLIIEFAMIPFCTETGNLEKDLERHFYVECPPFEELKHKLDPWVITHNKSLIETAHKSGLSKEKFVGELTKYFESKKVMDYFETGQSKKITIFGKSLNAIDLPFLNRDLGWSYMRNYFNHQVHDLSSVVFSMVDKKIIPPECCSGSELMKHLSMGDVSHTALEDAKNTAIMYLKLLK